MRKLLLLLALVLISLPAISQEKVHFMDNKSIGAADFILANPSFDGRGVVIFVLDNAVDPSISGLTLTSEGKVKVIDMQDFSGQLNLPLAPAKWEKNFDTQFLVDGGIKLSGVDKLPLKPVDDKYYLAEIDETKNFKNSGIKDINGNDDTKDKFFILAFKVKASALPLDKMRGLVKLKADQDVWVYYVDENNNGAIDDEAVKLDYKYNFDTFSFEKAKLVSKQRAPFTLSANISNDGSSIIINSGDGSHGSHCAGIASGCKINDFAQNNGIAPGAWVVSLKIGSNLLSGGSSTTEAMKKAYQYGVDFLKETGIKYGVFSMSYGIGAETPGQSEIENFLTDFARNNPNIVIVTSNGNNGPGINSTGNPAGADGIISVGAIIAPETIKDLYGSARKTNWVTHFSSRGGETSKPDVVAPGAASSTVPNFERGDAFWGTSMACPQIAGAAAVLISAAMKDNLEINGSMIKKAVKFSAKPLQGYSSIDYGSGLANIPEAYKYLKLLSDRKETDKIWGYEVSTANSFYPQLTGPAAFWKANGYFPVTGDRQNVSVKSIFPKDLGEADKEKVYRVLSLKTNCPWLDIDKSKIYLKGTQPANFSLIYDNSKIKAPGLYVGRVFGFAVDEKGNQYPDFDLQATVVIPHIFNQDNDYSIHWKNKSLGIGDIERIFVSVPPGASSMNVRLTPVDGKNYGMALYACAPDGRRVYFENASDVNTRNEVNYKAVNSNLENGIWEIIPYCYYQTLNEGWYNLEVSYYGIKSQPEKIDNLQIPLGETPKGSVSIFNEYNSMIEATINGSMEGYSKKQEYTQSGKPTFTRKFKVGDDISKVQFDIEMAIEEFNKFTDIAVNVYNESGTSLISTGISRKTGTIVFTPPSAGNYIFEILPGFMSNSLMNKDWTFSLEEKYYQKTPTQIKSDRPSLRILPGLWYTINYKLEKAMSTPPDGFKNFGTLRIIDSGKKMLAKEIELLIK